VTANTANVPSADPQAPRERDLAGYRLYSYFATPFTLADAGPPIADERVLPASFTPPYYDSPLVACVERYYMLTAVDTCGKESAPTPISQGLVADAGVKPEPPSNVQAHWLALRNAHVKWSPITRDVDGKAIKIERYEVYRSTPTDGSLPPSAAVWRPGPPLAVVYRNDYTDNAVPVMPSGTVVYYRVNGADGCGNVSDFSSEARLDCAFSGDVEIVTPGNGQLVSGVVPTAVRVVGGTDAYTGAVITYVHRASGQVHTATLGTPGPNWTYNGWTASPIGDYTITASVTNASGCTQFAVIEVTATTPPVPE